MFSFIKDIHHNRRMKKRLNLFPVVARRHNDKVLEIYDLFKSQNIDSCIDTSIRWINSFPILHRDIEHEKAMKAMSLDELFRHCSTNYDDTKADKGITQGERQRIFRERSYGIPVRYMNGSGVLFLMLGICYNRREDYENSLKWKTQAAKYGAFYDGDEFGPAEIWRIIELSTIKELQILNGFSEGEYIKSRIDEADLSYTYIPRDYVGPNPLGDMFNILASIKHCNATIDYNKEYFRVLIRDDELLRNFSTDGLREIVRDMINTINNDPLSVDRQFKQYFEELDVPQMN